MKIWLLTIGLILMLGGLFTVVGSDSAPVASEETESVRMKATGEPPRKMKGFLGWGAIVMGTVAVVYGFRSSGPLLPSVKPLDQQAGPGDWTP